VFPKLQEAPVLGNLEVQMPPTVCAMMDQITRGWVVLDKTLVVELPLTHLLMKDRLVFCRVRV
jgi:hypothetical protein